MFNITRKCATVDVSVNNVIQIRRTLKNKKKLHRRNGNGNRRKLCSNCLATVRYVTYTS